MPRSACSLERGSRAEHRRRRYRFLHADDAPTSLSELLSERRSLGGALPRREAERPVHTFALTRWRRWMALTFQTHRGINRNAATNMAISSFADDPSVASTGELEIPNLNYFPIAVASGTSATLISV